MPKHSTRWYSNQEKGPDLQKKLGCGNFQASQGWLNSKLMETTVKLKSIFDE